MTPLFGASGRSDILGAVIRDVDPDFRLLEDLGNGIGPAQRHDVDALHHRFDLSKESRRHFHGFLFSVCGRDRTDAIDPFRGDADP